MGSGISERKEAMENILEMGFTEEDMSLARERQQEKEKRRLRRQNTWRDKRHVVVKSLSQSKSDWDFGGESAGEKIARTTGRRTLRRLILISEKSFRHWSLKDRGAIGYSRQRKERWLNEELRAWDRDFEL